MCIRDRTGLEPATSALTGLRSNQLSYDPNGKIIAYHVPNFSYNGDMYSNKDIVHLLKSVAAAYTLTGAIRFRVIAYEKAADAVEDVYKRQVQHRDRQCCNLLL